MNQKKIIVTSNFTAQPIAKSMHGLLSQLGVTAGIEFAPYNQIFQQLLDLSSASHRNVSGVNVVLLRIEDLIDSRSEVFAFGPEEIKRIRDAASELANYLRSAQQFRVPTFILVCPASEKVDASDSVRDVMQSIEQSIVQASFDNPSVSVVTTERLAKKYDVARVDNPNGNALGHVPFTDQFFDALGIEIVRRIDAIWRRPYKVIVLDCDNTLWDGVIGEDGLDGIKFCDERIFLQEFIIRQSQQGMLICLCSKNNESDVWEVFDRRPEMRLKTEHIVASRINWNPKSTNIRSLAEELQVGIDTFIFVDDDPAVCSEVKANCPEVLTILLPSDLQAVPKFFEHLWVFDRSKVTEEDRERTRSYRQQIERSKLQKNATSMTSFLASLEIVCKITPITREQVPRISQLSMRTNQFNSTTIRRSEAELPLLIDGHDTKIMTVTVRDRFGDYGLVGALFYRLSDCSIIVDSFLLSCRVLGRGVEHMIIRHLGEIAAGHGKEFIEIKFNPSEKNAPFLNFLHEVADNSKVTIDGERTYKVPASVAKSIAPKEKSAISGEALVSVAEIQASIPNEGPLQGNIYIDIAKSLSERSENRSVGTTRELPRSAVSSSFAEASTLTESKLTELWKSILKVENIGVLDNFFELGGDSLMAVSLFVNIEAELGTSLPLSMLIASPTIRQLGERIDQGTSSPLLKYLVPIQPEGSQSPLFCMHAAGGNVMFYRDLAAELGSDRPVYGLQARGVSDKRETAHDRIEDMARDYLSEIRVVQPNGPYRVCGSSFGGLVAFEVAQQLHGMGEQVEFLGLFDTYAPGYLPPTPREGYRLKTDQLSLRARTIKQQLIEIQTSRERLDFLLKKIRKLVMRRKRKVLWRRNQFDIQYNAAIGKELPLDIQRNHKAIENARSCYKPTRFDGQLVLFRASEQPSNFIFDPFLGWKKYTTDNIVVVEVKGAHGALTVYPFARHLAEHVNYFLVAEAVSESSAANTYSRSWRA